MNYLEYSCNFLKCLGIFPPDTNSKWILFAFNIYRGILFLLSIFFTTLMTIQLPLSSDITLLARTIDIWTMCVSGLYKLLYMTVFNPDFFKLNMMLMKIQKLGSNAYGRSADQFVANYMRRVQLITVWYLTSGLLLALFLCSYPLIAYPRSNRSDIEYFNDPKSYPLSCWIPFIIKDEWLFLTIFFSHSIVLTNIIFTYLGIDTFMFGFLYAVGGQAELLNTSLKNIKDLLAKMENSTSIDPVLKYNENQQSLCYLKLRDCAKHHISILKFIKYVGKLFSSLIIVDYLHGITSITFLLFQLTISTNVSEMISIIFFIAVSVFHQFLNNYFGEYIVQKQLSVRNEAYNVPWYRLNKNSRSALSIMILRSNNPNMITGFYMYKLSFAAFLTFVKALYTYYMVLRRVNSGDN